MPKISVIIPTYNAEATILETLQSLGQQTLADFEILVINDGSTDRTLEVLKGFCDKRLRVFSFENAGATVARNRGIARAGGEFIAFLDADDLWSADKLEWQLAALEQHPEAGVAYSWTAFIDEQGQFLYKQPPVYFEGNVYPQLLLKNFLACGSVPLIRRQAIESVGEFVPGLASSQDWEYWLRLARQWSFVLVPKHQVFYRQRVGAISSQIDRRENCHLLVTERAFQAAPKELQYLKTQSLANAYEHIARLYISRRFDPEAVKQGGQKLKKAIQLYPKLLLNGETQRLLGKWLLMRSLPFKSSNYFVQFFRKIRTAYDSRKIEA